MKRAALERHLRKEGCQFAGHGGKHDAWWNPETGVTTAVPRHAEIAPWTVAAICKQLGVPKPPGK